jgi:hypothetical protein
MVRPALLRAASHFHQLREPLSAGWVRPPRCAPELLPLAAAAGFRAVLGEPSSLSAALGRDLQWHDGRYGVRQGRLRDAQWAFGAKGGVTVAAPVPAAARCYNDCRCRRWRFSGISLLTPLDTCAQFCLLSSSNTFVVSGAGLRSRSSKLLIG